MENSSPESESFQSNQACFKKKPFWTLITLVFLPSQHHSIIYLNTFERERERVSFSALFYTCGQSHIFPSREWIPQILAFLSDEAVELFSFLLFFFFLFLWLFSPFSFSFSILFSVSSYYYSLFSFSSILSFPFSFFSFFSLTLSWVSIY